MPAIKGDKITLAAKYLGREARERKMDEKIKK